MTSNGDAGQALPSAAARAAAAPIGPDTRQDPAMKALFRMSRTAGVGLQDYAEVNVLAVVGLILGLVSFLAYADRDSAPILIVPVAAIIVCTCAAVQILRSNRTQTGLPLAIVGLLLALGFAGSNLAAHAKTAAQEKRYHAELNALVGKILNASTTQGTDGAYELFDARFRETVKPETFQRVVQPRVQRMFGPAKPITSITVGDLVVYETDDSGTTTATTLLMMRGDGTLPDGSVAVAAETIDFKRTDALGWRIHSIPNWFGEVKKPGVGG